MRELDLAHPSAEVIMRRRAAHLVLTAERVALDLDELAEGILAGSGTRQTLHSAASRLRAAVVYATASPEEPGAEQRTWWEERG